MNIIRSLKFRWKLVKREILHDPLNEGKKMNYLWNYFLWHFIYQRRKTWVIYFENGFKSLVKPYPDNDSGENNIWTRNVDYYDTMFIRQQLKKGDYIVDAGCNVGNRTLALADLLSGALLIDAGKPAVQRTREHLQLNQLDLNKFIILHKAVGEKPGMIRFTDLGGANTGNKVLETTGEKVPTIEVEMNTIDNEVITWGHQPSFIKIDVEGQDLNALKGARQTLLSGTVRLVKFEHNHEDALVPLLEFFESIKWGVFALDNKGRPTLDKNYINKNMNLFAMTESDCRTLFH